MMLDDPGTIFALAAIVLGVVCSIMLWLESRRLDRDAEGDDR